MDTCKEKYIKGLDQLHNKLCELNFKDHTIPKACLPQINARLILGLDSKDRMILQSSKLLQAVEEYIRDSASKVIKSKKYRQFICILIDEGMISRYQAEKIFEKLIRIKRFEQGKSLEAFKIDCRNLQNFDRADKLLERLYTEEQSKVKLQEEKLNQIWNKIIKVFCLIEFEKLRLENCNLVKFGSTQTNFKTLSTDIDATILTNCYVNERILIRFIYEYLGKIIPNTDLKWKISKLDSDGVRIPLIKIEIDHEDSLYKVEISINNMLGILNTQLLDIYSKFDERASKLAVIVKKWAKCKGICNGQYFLSSYAYVNMVINFLQILDPPILPCLQKNYSNPNKIALKRQVSNKNTEISEISIDFPTDEIHWERKNKLNIGILFFKFIDFFCGDYHNLDASISIRDGHLIARKDILEDGSLDSSRKNPQNFKISIEDPYEDHNLGKSLIKYNQNDEKKKLEDSEKFDKAFKSAQNAYSPIFKSYFDPNCDKKLEEEFIPSSNESNRLDTAYLDIERLLKMISKS